EPATLASEGARSIEPAPRIVSKTPGMDVVWESSRDGIRIARISGVIETTAVSLLSDELNRELAAAPRAILFDLNGVEYISSSGWGQFARAYEATHAAALFGMGPDLNEVYAFLEFSSFLKSYTTEEEAIRGVLTPGAVPPPVTRPAPALEDHDESDHAGAVDDVLGQAPSMRPTDKPRIEPAVSPAPKPRVQAPAPAREPEEAPRSGELDVASATQDHQIDKDDKLRTLGWQKYGQRLKKRADSGKLKDSGGGQLDPHDEDKS
ncbi:MAG TPA: STAS domain-containing protein, partial [Candidatus Krumholzibacteria bacterium]|nr:STAS domain-containing protein [Candidatus Krumholzibacteria bacterium]